MTVSSKHWQRLYTSSGVKLAANIGKSPLPLAPLVRSLCLEVAMELLYGPPSNLYGQGDVATVCRE
jgi:hypothetical protein